MSSPVSIERLIERPGARAKIYHAALRLFAERGGGALTVSDLADAAGLARGTIYNNLENPETLFNDVAAGLAHEMIGRVETTMQQIDDPVERLATGMRLFVRRAHEEPDWGRFIVRFALSHTTLQAMMDEPPARDITRALDDGRFRVDAAKLKALIALLNGATLAAINAVVTGHQAWRAAGSDAAELFLRAGGIRAGEARRIAHADLPPLAISADARARQKKGKPP